MSDEKCVWTIRSFRFIGDDFWDTSCGEAFTFAEGDPKDNRFNYCPYCGKRIEVNNE